ncbi:hypothetical protein AB0I60_29340 [Actinosynnema sp. NPDC050436]|uniref:hypothetical protein n=1 Tax=Actinosynnema sp. NPDC050436 TaxID=3155659 RepID=UPI0033E09133
MRTASDVPALVDVMPLRGRRVAVQGCGAAGAVSRELRANAASVVAESAERGTTTHDAARAVAQDRVPAAMRLKGRAA